MQSTGQATAHFSQDEDALYRRMLKEASEGIVEASEESIGFLRAVSWGLLRGQGNLSEGFSRLEGMQAKLWSGLAKLLAEPEEKDYPAEERRGLVSKLKNWLNLERFSDNGPSSGGPYLRCSTHQDNPPPRRSANSLPPKASLRS